jgi:hypothetical protein
MNRNDPIRKEMISICAKNYLLNDRQSHRKPQLLKPCFPNEIMPTNRQFRQWRVFGQINEIIKKGQININNDLGIWTPSFCSGIKDSGMFHKNPLPCYRFYQKPYKEFLLDIKEIKLPIKITEIRKGKYINLSGCSFMNLGVNNGAYNYNEYLGGLFTGCRVLSVEREECMVINPKNEATLKKVITVLGNYKIAYKRGNNGQILISPFFGCLFFGYMPIHSSTRIINIKRAYQGSKLALVYWHMVREVGQPVAPLKAQILPYALSYASYWNKGILKNTDIRQMGVDMGVFGISDKLRELMKEWIKYHS